MCTTPYCYGECDECIRDQKMEDQWKDDAASCPYKKKCNFKTLNVKTDQCSVCGKLFYY